MLELPHALVGAAIATKIPNPFISIPLAFLSHLLLDFIPHWNPGLYTETKKYGKPTKQSTWIVIGDTTLSLIGGLSLASLVLPNVKHTITIVLACFAAVLLDVIEGPYFFLNLRHPLLKKIIEFQHRYQGRAKLIPGLAIQGVVAVLGIVVALS